MKKFYIIFVILLIIGIGSGIYYLEVVRPGSAELPEDIVMDTAFDGEYSFGDMDPKVRIIEFMYVNCPDICPVTTLEMSKLRNDLEKEGVFGDQVEFLTITINPRDDTPEVLRRYANQFEVTSDDDGWKFLRSNEENTKEVADSLGFLYRDPGTGDIIHSTYAYFLDEKNNLIEKFTMGNAFDTDRAYKRIMSTIN